MKYWLTIIWLGYAMLAPAQTVSEVGKGWASNSVNTVAFRKNSVVSFQGQQFTAYYDSLGYVVLAKRMLGSQVWTVKTTNKKGNIKDAHNSISIMLDGEGYLHMSWDHHGNKLRYCKSVAPFSLELKENEVMTGMHETSVTYPEFYRFSNGDLLFMYRDGASGKGNLVLNKYSVHSKQWTQLHNHLIDGEGKRNAYWQACVDAKDQIHISWVWRESADVSSNHDMCYAKSVDGGISWQKSNQEPYTLPINMATAQVVCAIPQKSELMNQTSMTVNDNGEPFIATYFKDANTQKIEYQIIFQNQHQWYVRRVSNRVGTFSLSGTGTKKIPIARPAILIKHKTVYVLVRDEEQKNALTLYYAKNHPFKKWKMIHVLQENLGAWEPTYDIDLWKEKGWLQVFVQATQQGDGEKTISSAATAIHIITVPTFE